MNAERFIWFKEQLVPAAEATIQVLSPSVQFGLNVFEGLRGYWVEDQEQIFIFKMEEHLARLRASCRLIGFDAPPLDTTILGAIRSCLSANGYREDVAVRVMLFLDEEGTWSSLGTPEMFIAPIAKSRTDLNKPPSIAACITSWRRISDNVLPPRIKCGANYINSRHGALEAHRNGYDLPIFLDDAGKVTEGPGACIAIVRGGSLITPPPTSSILESITRDTLLELANRIGIDTEVRIVDRTELYLADEIFFCGSAAEVSPVTSVDRFLIADGNPGLVTLALAREYQAVTTNQREWAQHWLTPVYPPKG